jgi:hypothetical protein
MRHGSNVRLAGANPQCMEWLDARLVKKVWRKMNKKSTFEPAPEAL